MKIDHSGSEVISTSLNKEHRFGVNQGAQMFKVLSSTLYSDKVRAIIRELSCNAWDAHVAAGKSDVPFEIHLPTVHEPWFSIKDYGTGLSDNDLMDLFCTYFGSNKTRSNKFIGALGLGSKSPFCYTPMYNIRVTFEGDGRCPECMQTYSVVGGVLPQHGRTTRERQGHGGTFEWVEVKSPCGGSSGMPMVPGKITRMYEARVDEKGEPTVQQMGQDVSTPKLTDGIELKFAVKQQDIWEFENKAKMALEFFVPQPILNVNLQVIKQDYVLRTDRWGLRDGRGTLPAGVRAIMGNVAYSVGYIDISRLNKAAEKMSQMPLDIFFDIGNLSFTASREALELDEKTVRNLTDAYVKIHGEIVDTVRTRIDACASAWEARLLIYGLTVAPGLGGIVNDAWNSNKLDGVYTNFMLQEKQPSLNSLDWKSTSLIGFAHNSRASVRAKKSFVMLRPIADDPVGVVERKRYDHNIEVNPEVHFIINDLDKRGETYVHYFIQQAASTEAHGKRRVYVFSRASKETPLNIMLDEAKLMLVRLGSPKYELASALKTRYEAFVKKDRESRSQYRRTGQRPVVELKPYFNRTRDEDGWFKAWRKSDDYVLHTETKYYISLEQLRGTESGFSTAYEFRDFVENVRKSGAFDLNENTPVYGLRKNAKLRKNPAWVELVHHVMDSVQKMMTPEKEAQLTLLLCPFDAAGHYDNLLEYVAKNASLAADSPFQCFAVILAEAREHRDLTGPAGHAFKAVLDEATRRGYYKQGPVTDLNKMWQDMIRQYPILTMLGMDYHRDERAWRKAVLDYIQMVDEKFQQKTKAAEAS